MPASVLLDQALALHRAGRDLRGLPPETLEALEEEIATWFRRDMQTNQLLYYEAVSPDAETIHLSTARECGAKGGNKCLVAGSRVVTGRGLIPVEEIKAGDEIRGPHRWDGVVVEVFEPAHAEVFRLCTQRGYEFAGNAQHPIFTAPAKPPGWHRGTAPDGPMQERSLGEARVGDFIRIGMPGAFPDVGDCLPDDAYFLGVMIGDGSWTAPTGVMRVTSADEPILAWLTAYLHGRGIRARRQGKRGTPAIDLAWCSVAFKRWMALTWGVSLVHSRQKSVPDAIWRGTREAVAAFLRGYADTDGCATTKPSVVWTSASTRLLREVQVLLLRFGIVASRHEAKAQGPFRSWRLEVTGRNLRLYAHEIGFALPRKADRLPTTPPPALRARWDRIASVTPAGVSEVYGFTVLPHHRYFADGVLHGNSGKTGTMLAEGVIQMLGVPAAVPESLRGRYPAQKLRGIPIRVRLVVTSLTTAWDTNLKPKLQWWMWNGRPNAAGLQGDPRTGHWGLIPQAWLLHGDWNQSWSEKHRVLTLRHPQTGEPWSSLQVMGHDQDIKEFNQGAVHLALEDEIPPENIHRANLIRAMEYGGQVITGGTPPDEREEAVAVAWFLDQILGPGLEGANPDEVYAVALWTEHNRALDQAWVEQFTRGLTDEQRRARLHGDFIHLAGTIIKGFREKATTWCVRCAVPILPVDGHCVACGGRDLIGYANVWTDADLDWPGPAGWPTLFYMDPHQAKPTACLWVKVDPQDGWWVIQEAEIQGDAHAVKTEVERIERDLKLDVVWRKADPKITAQTNQFATRFQGQTFTIKQAFDEVGFHFDEANTNFSVAIDRLEQALKPNPFTRVPRLRIHRTACPRTIYQITRFTWDRERPSRNNSDFPACLRYLGMDDPDWRSLQALRHGRGVQINAGGTGRNRRTGW